CRTSTTTPTSARSVEPAPVDAGPGRPRAARHDDAFAAMTPAVMAPAVMTRILGIDAGSQRTGVGIVDVDATGRATHVHHQPLLLLDDEDFPRRLKLLVDGLTALIVEYRPDEVAIEKVFMSKNADSALKLGQARGAA